MYQRIGYVSHIQYIYGIVHHRIGINTFINLIIKCPILAASRKNSGPTKE